MFDLNSLLKKMAAGVSGGAIVDVEILSRTLGLDCRDCPVTKTSGGDFIVSGARIDAIPGLVDVLVMFHPYRSIVLSPETKGAAGAFDPAGRDDGEIVTSPTGLGFVWRKPVDAVTIGASASLPDRTIQIIFADSERNQ